MVRGPAARMSRWSDARRRQAARYCEAMSPATAAARGLMSHVLLEPLRGLAQGAVLAARVKVDLFDESPMALDSELNHDIDEEVEECLDVGARELLPSPALLDEKHQLLEGELGT